MSSLLAIAIAGLLAAEPPDLKPEKAAVAPKAQAAESEVTKEEGSAKTPKTSLRLRKRTDSPSDSKTNADSNKADDEAPPVVNDRRIPSPPAKKKDSLLDDKLLEDLELPIADVPDDEQNPLLRVGRRMRSVEEQFARREATDDTVDLQRKIVADLDELLKQCQNSNNQNQNQQSQSQRAQRRPSSKQASQRRQQPAKAQQQGRQAAQAPGAKRTLEQDIAQLREQKAVWGHLSAMLRDEMSQYAKETFLPKYREMLERYYTTIAKESGRPN